MTAAVDTVSLDAARELLIDLVSIPSPSGSESACATRLESFLAAHGREVWIDEVGNVRAPGDDGVLLTSHIDTVPGVLPVKVEGGTLWGRGSVDAKGSLVAMAVAAVRTGASFAGVVREETDSAGAMHLIDTRDPPATLINGEPSGWDGIALGYRGAVRGTYHLSTPATHHAAPADNAIELAIGWLERAKDTSGTSTPSLFERVSLTPVQFVGTPSDGGERNAATVEVDLRIPPGTDIEAVTASIDAVAEVGRITWSRAVPPVMVSPRNAVATALRGSIRAADGEPRQLRKTGTSDMNLFFEAWGVPMATYGPGDSGLDHTPDERIALDEFDRATRALETATTTLLHRDNP